MKVLLINAKFNGGGAERCARELFEYLPRWSGAFTELWVGSRDPELPRGVESMPRRGEGLLSGFDAFPFWADWRFLGSIKRLDGLKERDFDIVHLHNIYDGCGSLKALKRAYPNYFLDTKVFLNAVRRMTGV